MLIRVGSQVEHESSIWVWMAVRLAHSSCGRVECIMDAACCQVCRRGAGVAVRLPHCMQSALTGMRLPCMSCTDLVGALNLQASAAACTRRTFLAFYCKATADGGGAKVWPARQSADH